jgi:hypothetical protein
MHPAMSFNGIRRSPAARRAVAMPPGHCLSAVLQCVATLATCALSTSGQRSLSRGNIFRALNVQFNQTVEISGLEATPREILHFVHCTNITGKRMLLPNKTNV